MRLRGYGFLLLAGLLVGTPLTASAQDGVCDGSSGGVNLEGRPTPPDSWISTSNADRAALQAYAGYITPELRVAREAMRAFVRGNEQATANPLLIADPRWTVQMAFVLAIFDTVADKIERAPAVPPSARPMHRNLEVLAQDLRYVVREYTRGIDDRSLDNLNNATARLNQMNSRLQQAEREAFDLNR
jgi:hypothetical protein